MDPISVIIPTHNRAHLIPRALRSALRAIEPGDEIIVVDDGSTDTTEAALEPFRDRIRYLRKENGGPGPARTHGILAARHALVSFLDSDDEWMPDTLRILRSLMKARPDLVACFGDFAMKDEEGRIHPKYLVNWNDTGQPWTELFGSPVTYSSLATLPEGRDDFNVFIGDAYLPMSFGAAIPVWTSVARRVINGSVVVFPEDQPVAAEWEYFGKIVREGPTAFLDCDVAWNHGHSGPRVTNTGGAYGLYTARIRITERVWGRDPAFLAKHGQLYKDVMARAYMTRARWLLSRGRMAEAREDLAASRSRSIPLSLFSMLPGRVARGIGELRRTLQNGVGRLQGAR